MSRLAPAILATILQRTGAFRGKWRLVRRWTRLVDASAPHLRDLPGGGRICCDVSIPYEASIWLGLEEELELRTLAGLLRPGDRFVDCGANVGLWTLSAAPLVGAAGRVWAFEPNPVALGKLRRNLSASGFDNVRIVPAAAGRAGGEAFLRCDEEHNRSELVATAGTATSTVRVVRLDEELAGEKIAGCKIDVEGAELDVLRGAEEILATQHPWLCVELNPEAAGTDVLKSWEVHRFLSRLGYVARRFEDALTPSSALPDSWRTGRYCNLFYARPAAATA